MSVVAPMIFVKEKLFAVFPSHRYITTITA